MNTTSLVSYAFVLVPLLASCQAHLGIPGLSTDSESGTGNNTSTTAAPTPSNASTAAAPTSTGPSEAERESEAEIRHQLELADEIAKTGKVSVSAALSGFSPDERIKYIQFFYKNGTAPSDVMINRLKDAMHKQLEAAENAASKDKLSKPAAPDPSAQKAIRANFETHHKGVQVKSVYMIQSDWKVNYTDIGVIRNRYKNAEVIIAIQGSTKACLAVPADAAQQNLGGSQYSTEYSHDEFLEGLAVPCP